MTIKAVRPTGRVRRRRSGEEGLLPEALDAPVPGSLLVLLSRLHRSELPAAEERWSED